MVDFWSYMWSTGRQKDQNQRASLTLQKPNQPLNENSKTQEQHQGILKTVFGSSSGILSKLEAALSFQDDSDTKEVVEQIHVRPEKKLMNRRTLSSNRKSATSLSSESDGADMNKIISHPPRRTKLKHKNQQSLKHSKHHHVESKGCSLSSDMTSSESTSEFEDNDVSVESSDADHDSGTSCNVNRRSDSDNSLRSWASSLSNDSQFKEIHDESMHFMKKFVSKLFVVGQTLTMEEKAKFGVLCRYEIGRMWFSRFVNSQRVYHQRVDESTFYRLVQHFAIALFECKDADDYSTAKSLMNMCFTFYHEFPDKDNEMHKEFLYVHLREQPLWQSLRFWNAAFFDAVQCERLQRPIATRSDFEQYSPEEMSDETTFQENIMFGQLGTFTCSMHAFGLSREMCLEFLRKQSTIANLRNDQIKMLRENVERMYLEPLPK